MKNCNSINVDKTAFSYDEIEKEKNFFVDWSDSDDRTVVTYIENPQIKKNRIIEKKNFNILDYIFILTIFIFFVVVLFGKWIAEMIIS